MRPGQYLTRSLVFFDNRGVDGAVNGLAALIGGTSGRLPPAADRLRPLLRPVDVRGRRRRGRRHAAGEALTVMRLPLAHHPRRGPARRVPSSSLRCPTDATLLAKQVALGVSLVAARADHRDGAAVRLRQQGDVPVQRGPRVDPAVRRQLRARRRRHRAGADRDGDGARAGRASSRPGTTSTVRSRATARATPRATSRCSCCSRRS